MDKTDRLRDYGLAFLLYEQGLGICGYELIRELFIFTKLILNSYLMYEHKEKMCEEDCKELADTIEEVVPNFIPVLGSKS